uniref:Uncharacterized protein n=1 Tax=viral metagenome TaxID=1070528 RepID=A0A6C0ICX4_9ZZZZ
MRLTKNSKNLMLYLTKHKFFNHTTKSKKTDTILIQLYNDILESYNFLVSLKQTKGNYYNVSTKKLISSTQIVKPKIFNANSFPEMVRTHIDEFSIYEINYSFSLFDRNIKIFFTVEEDNIELKIDTFNKYVDIIVMWLYIINQYASKQCATHISIYFYFTSLEKTLPNSNILVLDEIHVNTAFTTTCPKDSEIVVFRKEEWFKVFLHETFHNFGLDFSDMNNNDVSKCILNILKVKSDVNLYESYTEIWAEIMNTLFCSFISLKDKHNIDLFLSKFDLLINFERTYSLFQLVKILDFMGLNYTDLYSNSQRSKILRDNLYKEKTNILSYFVVKTILINNYQSFLLWCHHNNTSLLQFKKTSLNQNEFCELIKKNYKTQSMLDGVYNADLFLNKMKRKNKDKNTKYFLSNLRMSICELG